MAYWYKTNLIPRAIPRYGNDEWNPVCYREPMDSFLYRVDCPLANIEFKPDENITTITIALDDDAENKTVLKYEYSNSGVALYINDEFFTNIGYYSDKITVWIIYSDSFFYIAYALNDIRCFTYLYELLEFESESGLIDVREYEGWDAGSYFQNLELRDKNDEESSAIKHTKMLDYSTKFKTIDFTYSRIFNYDNDEEKWFISSVIDENFLTCSNVSIDTIISFNEVRHYSIDTNTLVELEPVEEYEESDTGEEDDEEEE